VKKITIQLAIPFFEKSQSN